jgi:hypothetical protein
VATETQRPAGTSASSNITGDHLDLDDDPDSADGNWATADADGTDSDMRVSFDTPTGDPTTGAGLQEIRAWVRRSATGGNDPQCRIEVWDGGSAITGGVGSDTTITSDSGQLLTLTWDATNLATADGSGVEVRLYGTRSGGGPSVRRSVDFGAVEWNVNYTPASQTVTHSKLGTSESFPATHQLDLGLTHTALASSESLPTTHTVANVGGTQNITHTALGSSESFPTTHQLDLGLTHTALATSESFGSHTLTTAYTVSHSALDTSSLGSHTLTTAYGVTHTALGTSESFGSHTLAAAYDVTHSALGSSENFPAHTVTPGAVTLTHSALATSESFPTHTVALSGGAQTVTHTALGTSESFGSHTLIRISHASRDLHGKPHRPRRFEPRITYRRRRLRRHAHRDRDVRIIRLAPD